MLGNFNYRFAIGIMGFISTLLLNPWVPAIAILALAFLWRAWEAILLGLFIDLLWLPPGHLPYFTIGAIVVVWIMEPIRREFLV